MNTQDRLGLQGYHGNMKIAMFTETSRYLNKMVREPNVSPHKQIIKDDDVKECISTE